MILPKVKSTIFSNPKFLKKTHMLRMNKYSGGTFRNTSLEAQQLDRPRSQILNVKMHTISNDIS